MKAAQDMEQRRMNIVRFGMMAIPPVAWAVAFAPLFLISNGFRMDWISTALIPSFIEAVAVAVVCFIIWYAYRQFVLPRS